jgi:hypothetical protein
LLNNTFSYFEGGNTDFIVELSCLINASPIILPYKLRRKSFQIELDYLCSDNGCEEKLEKLIKLFFSFHKTENLPDFFSDISKTMRQEFSNKINSRF